MADGNGGDAEIPVQVLVGELVDDDPVVDLAMAEAQLREAAEGRVEHALRVYRPRGPMAVFGRREVRLPGYQAAVEVAKRAGFQPAVRITGGRAVAYTTRALVVDIVQRRATADDDPLARFETYGALLVAAFGAMGIEAQMGAVPGEYCPGAHSINVRGVAKLVGTSQRVVRGAWLFSALIVVDDQERVAQALADIYRALGQPFDPASVGSVLGELPARPIDEVERVVVASLTQGKGEHMRIDAALLGRARALAPAAVSGSPGPSAQTPRR